MMVGNKIDLIEESDKHYSLTAEAIKFCKKKNLLYEEISVKNNVNV